MIIGTPYQIELSDWDDPRYVHFKLLTHDDKINLLIQSADGNPRQLPLADSVIEALKIYLQWKASHHQPVEAKAPFFCTLYTKKRLVPLDIQRIVKNASKVFSVNLTPHDLRHTFAVDLYRVLGDLSVVQQALGLRSIEAVKIYQKYDTVDGAQQEQLQRAIEAFDDSE